MSTPSDLVERREAGLAAFRAVLDRRLLAGDRDADGRTELLLLGEQEFTGEAMRALYRALAGGAEDDGRMRQLRATPQAESGWGQALRMGLGLLGVRGHYRPPRLIRPERDIVAFHRCEVSSAYASKRNVTPIVMRYGDWFAQGDRSNDSTCEDLGPDHDVLSEALNAAWRAAAAPASVAMPDMSRFRAIARRIDFHRAWLTRQAAFLPKEYWASTMGNPLNRIFARAVQKNGGMVVGFDHGSSSGMWDCDFQVRIEFPFLSRFVTFGPAMAAGLRANAGAESIVDIEWVTPDYRAIPQVKSGRLPAGRTVYFPAAYAGRTYHSPALYDDDRMIEWQWRLLAALKGVGTQTAIKPHPEGRQDVSQEFAETLGIDVITGRFEEQDWNDTIAVFDTPETSVFRSALIAGMPIILFECPRLKMRQSAREMLARRVALVHAWLDDGGLIQTTWNGLGAAATRAIALAEDQGIASAYFGARLARSVTKAAA